MLVLEMGLEFELEYGLLWGTELELEWEYGLLWVTELEF